MSSATFTDLLRSPKTVVAQTEAGPVLITRRDAADLVLMRAGDLQGQSEGIALASRIMRAALIHGGNMRAALHDAFAWASILNNDELDEFSATIDRLVWSSAELGTYGALLDAIRSWKGTAEAIADGLAAVPEADWLDPCEQADVATPKA